MDSKFKNQNEEEQNRDSQLSIIEEESDSSINNILRDSDLNVKASSSLFKKHLLSNEEKVDQNKNIEENNENLTKIYQATESSNNYDTHNFNPELVRNIRGKSEYSTNESKLKGSDFGDHHSQFSRSTTKIAFVNGKPKHEDDILKLQCPLYKCDKNTLLTKKTVYFDIPVDKNAKKGSIYLRNASKLKKQATIMSNIPEIDATYLNESVDIELANTMEIRTFNSLFATILEVINCIIRYTIIQFPFCMKILGLFYGPIIISLIGLMSIFSVYLLIKVKQATGDNSYSTFAYRLWGLSGKIFILVLNCLSSFGSCLSYIIIFLKIMPKLVNLSVGFDTFIADQTLLSILLGFWLLIYCFKKEDVSSIKSAAYWGVLGIIFYLVLNIVDLLYCSWIEDFSNDKFVNLTTIIPTNDVFSCVACIILSFSFHTYCFPIYECLDTPDQKKMIVTSAIGIFTSMLIYLLVGIIGYILYGNNISDSILDSLSFDSLAIFQNIAFVLNVVMSFPLTFSSMKHYLTFLIEICCSLCRDCCHKKDKHKSEPEHNVNNDNKINEVQEQLEEDNDNERNDTFPNKNDEVEVKEEPQHLELVHIPEYVENMIILFVFILVFYIALHYPNMKTLFGFLGATTANLFSFILPAIFYISLSKHNVCNVRNIIPFSFIFIGFAGMLFCLISNIISVVHGQSH